MIQRLGTACLVEGLARVGNSEPARVAWVCGCSQLSIAYT